MGFVITISIVVAVVFVANGGDVSRGSAESNEEETESSLEVASVIQSIYQECGKPNTTDDGFAFSYNPNMTRMEKCYMECVLKKGEVISEDNILTRNGVHRWDALESELNNYETPSNEFLYVETIFKCTNDETIYKCSDVTDEDGCEAAYKIISCGEEACPDDTGLDVETSS